MDNGYFEKTYAGEEEDLGEPSEHVVARIALSVDVPSVPSIADLDLSDLYAESCYTEKCDNRNGVVVGAHRSQG
ncbi:hypothetical protein ACHAPO_009082 [Fusarium lateritium]